MHPTVAERGPWRPERRVPLGTIGSVQADRVRPTRAELRASIERAATELFAERGYHATSVDDIVAAAGVSKPALYRCFDSKKELHMALLERHREELAAGPIAALLESTGPLEERVASMIDAWFAHVEREPFVARLLLQDPTGDPDVHALHRELQGRQRAADVALLRELSPHLPEEELEPVGEAIRSCLYGLALWWNDHPERPRSTVVAAMMHLLRGLVPPAETPLRP